MSCVKYEDFYCTKCGACGEEGCCPITMCLQEGGLYCDHYKELQKEKDEEAQQDYIEWCKKHNVKL